jgi:hypothetical protein
MISPAVARKRTSRDIPPIPPSPRPERGRDRGEVVYIGAEIEPEIARAMAAYIDTHGSTKRFIIEKALVLFLKEKGFWPPPSPN